MEQQRRPIAVPPIHGPVVVQYDRVVVADGDVVLRRPIRPMVA
jgi:hypothetical protein